MCPETVLALLVLMSASAVVVPPSAGQDVSDQEAELLRTDSRAPYVHRITLYDHDGVVIDPEDEFAGPYSPRTTCAKCHPYAVIAGGWHFNASNEGVPAGRRGEPWLLVDPATGTQLPISGRKWPGTFAPEQIGLTNWDFVLRLGHHMPGGDYGEPSNEQVQQSSKALRWGISGKLEIDCMFCHAADQQHDPAEAARQIEMENFKWAPTVALGLAVVRGEARKAPDDWDPLMPPDPDFPERAGPRLVWDKRRFDPDDRVFFNITRRPPNERCYFCHSFREVGPRAAEHLAASQDVHLAAGLLCVDCHRHGIDHMMTRGYATEAAERGEPTLAAFSCEGCHLGAQGEDDASVSLGGRYGAPHPQHRGLPPLHFEKLACTACHSGPWPEMNAKRFQTAMAHGLGLATRERADDNPPYIVGPVFARQHDGKIAPQRLADTGSGPLEAYTWPLAHDVRPGAQSLGIHGCEDCHGNRQAIFAGEVYVGEGYAEMHEFHGYDPILADAWGLGFVFRPAFKVFGFVCAGVIGLILLHYALARLGGLLRRFR